MEDKKQNLNNAVSENEIAKKQPRVFELHKISF